MKVCTFLTDGFETVEALAVVDILKRAGVEVDLVSIQKNLSVTSAQNIKVQAEYQIEDYDFHGVDLLFLPGGGGHKNYKNCKKLENVVKDFANKHKNIAAICAAPSYLGYLGLLKGKKAMCFPGFEEQLIGAEFVPAPERVVTDGNITTSRGMGTSVDLGLELVRILVSEEKAEQIGKSIQYL